MAALQLPQRCVGRGFLPAFGLHLPMAAKMAALHHLQRYAFGHPCPWRPGWPPYIYLNVIIYLNVM